MKQVSLQRYLTDHVHCRDVNEGPVKGTSLTRLRKNYYQWYRYAYTYMLFFLHANRVMYSQDTLI